MKKKEQNVPSVLNVTTFVSLFKKKKKKIYLLAIQTKKQELSHIVSGDEHLSTHRHVDTTVPKAAKQNSQFTQFAG